MEGGVFIKHENTRSNCLFNNGLIRARIDGLRATKSQNPIQ